MPVNVVQGTDGRWHRTDILACVESSVLDTGAEREVDPDELGEERCSNCTWANQEEAEETPKAQS